MLKKVGKYLRSVAFFLAFILFAQNLIYNNSYAAEVERLTPKDIYDNKYCFLTFDDGPSINTNYVLDILDIYNIKATFFVTYQKELVDVYKKIIERGHTIGIHTASHNANVIYKSFDGWKADFEKVYNFVVDTTGYKPTLYRFPWGSTNKLINEEVRDQIKAYLKENGIDYVDWNVDTGDSDTNNDLEKMINNVLEYMPYRKVPVILMHDSESKGASLTILSVIIENLQSKGYKFISLNNNVPLVQQGENWDFTIDKEETEKQKDDIVASESVIESEEEKIERLIKEGNEKYDTNKCYLPTLFSQPLEQPYDSDIFGETTDTTPIYSVVVDKDDKTRYHKIGLTFDSAYHNEYTYEILDILDDYNIKATFFMTYEYMAKNPNQILDIIKRGHEIGNHSTTHPYFNKATESEIVDEVLKCHYFLKNLCGVDMSLFRFPYGAYDAKSVHILKKLGYYPIQWSFDSLDWRELGTEALIDRFTSNDTKIYSGAIILCHNGAKFTPSALPTIIEHLQENDMQCVRVSDLIYKHGFTLERGRQKKE